MPFFRKIVLVDDAPDHTGSFESVAKHVCPEIKVTSAKNGVEIFRVLKTTPNPDLIVLDLNMPLMNGFQCLKQLRKNEKFSYVKIMIYTSSSSKADIDYCMKNGANHYVVKPTSVQGMEVLIKELSKGVIKDRTAVWD